MRSRIFINWLAFDIKSCVVKAFRTIGNLIQETAQLIRSGFVAVYCSAMLSH